MTRTSIKCQSFSELVGYRSCIMSEEEASPYCDDVPSSHHDSNLLKFMSWANCMKLRISSRVRAFPPLALFVLFWHFTSNLLWHTVFSLPAQIENLTYRRIVLVDYTAVILLFSPVVGFVADVKFGRYQVLKFSSYLFPVSFIIFSVSTFLLAFTETNYYSSVFSYFLFASAIASAILSYMVHNATIFQFSTDQLRDAPTQVSSIFLCLMFWVNSLGRPIASGINSPSNQPIKIYGGNISFGQPKTSLIESVTLYSLMSYIAIIIILHKKRSCFFTERIVNSYKLVFRILQFVWHHDRPARRPIAFVYCEDVRPSRIDFAKARYGGSFSTEEVENVKFFL